MTLGPLMIDLVGPQVQPQERDMLAHPLVGGVVLFARNYASPEQLLELTHAIHAARNPPLLIAVDHEGGRVQRFRSGFSRLPPARRLGQLFDTDRSAGIATARGMGWLMAETMPMTVEPGVTILISAPICTRASLSLTVLIAERSSMATACAPATETIWAMRAGGAAGNPRRSRNGAGCLNTAWVTRHFLVWRQRAGAG